MGTTSDAPAATPAAMVYGAVAKMLVQDQWKDEWRHVRQPDGEQPTSAS
jgi:hypothetical protein